ncbi:MAG: exodeoxyribonuclease VII small subunit [Oscillospiraceae bacterium]
MTYEESMKRLGEIVKTLEEDKLSLDEALDLYKEGVELSVDCKKSLEAAKLRVKILSEKENDDTAEEQL